MLRRNPTKIELKLEDIQDFSNKLKENLDSRKTSGNKLSESSTSIEIPIKSRQEVIEERIGYNPKPKKPN
ncbi:UNVERIFIED_CONTAM: hypothetical protein RMT77_010139 [Armadillidium vulgare]